MTSSAPGATRERPAPEVTRRNTGAALGLVGGMLGALMALLFLAFGAFGVAIDTEATRAEETVVMIGTVVLLLLAALGTIGGVVGRDRPRAGSALQGSAAVGGLGVFLVLALADVSGMVGSSSEGYLVDAAWMVVGFWSIPALVLAGGAVATRLGIE